MVDKMVDVDVPLTMNGMGVNISKHKAQGCCRCLAKAVIGLLGTIKTKEKIRQYLSKRTKSQPGPEPLRCSQTLPTAEFGQEQLFAPAKSAYMPFLATSPAGVKTAQRLFLLTPLRAKEPKLFYLIPTIYCTIFRRTIFLRTIKTKEKLR